MGLSFFNCCSWKRTFRIYVGIFSLSKQRVVGSFRNSSCTDSKAINSVNSERYLPALRARIGCFEMPHWSAMLSCFEACSIALRLHQLRIAGIRAPKKLQRWGTTSSGLEPPSKSPLFCLWGLLSCFPLLSLLCYRCCDLHLLFFVFLFLCSRRLRSWSAEA